MSDPTLFSDDPASVPFNPYDRKKVIEEFLKLPGMEFGWDIKNVQPDPKTTISREAQDELRDHMVGWVMSRILRKFTKTGRGAKRVQVTVTVSLDGEQVVKGFDVPYFSWPDGEHKRSGK